MVKDLPEESKEAKAQALSYSREGLENLIEYHRLKQIKAELVLKQIDEIYRLRREEAEMIVKGKQLAKATGKYMELFETLERRFQEVHGILPEKLLKASV